MSKLDDEILVAYVDGELPPDEAAKVDAAVRSDSEVRDAVRVFRDSADIVKRGLDPILDEPVPENVRALFDRPAPRRTPARSFDLVAWLAGAVGELWRPAVPVAASLALAIGLGGGFLLSTLGSGDGGPAGAGFVQTASDLEAFEDALEKTATATTVAWSNTGTGTEWTVTPVFTFKSKQGSYCREYEQQARTGDRRVEISGIACRASDGTWRIRTVVARAADGDARPAAADSGTGYVPASGPELGVIDATIEELVGEGPIDAADEARLIRSGWR